MKHVHFQVLEPHLTAVCLWESCSVSGTPFPHPELGTVHESTEGISILIKACWSLIISGAFAYLKMY